MEAVENALVEGKILWLAQTILEGIFSGKHDEWIRDVGLGEGMEQLKSEIERVETVVAAAKGRATGNKPLARSLARLRELMYDADDLLDELDYFRLQEQVEKGAIACSNESERTDGDEAEQVEGSGDNPHTRTSKRRKNRCKEWDHFTKIIVDGKTRAQCRYCGKEVACGGSTGTKGLSKHISSKKCLRERAAADQQQNPTSDAAPNDATNENRVIICRKRMRADEASTSNMAATAHPWNSAGISKRMHQMASQLQSCRRDVREFVKDSVASTDIHQRNTSDTRLRTSSLIPRQVYGRDKEKNSIISKIKAAESDFITVLPVVGVAGAGKTAVAQLVYNDTYVENQFERIWIWVSENFDKVILTREMLASLSQESTKGSPENMDSRAGISGYEKLQRMLKGYMASLSKRFLLVLDDVWDSMDDCIWNELLSPLQSSHVKGNVILVTARNLSVARRIGTVEPIKLGALGNEDVWLLCKAFAFGSENYEQHPTLNIIGQQIAAKLKGNPLAAKTAGELLKQHLTVNHWSSVLKCEDWKSLQLSTGIMTALKLSYDHLPYHLQQCFLYCSMFPNDHQFLAEDLVRIWISQGFVRCTNSRKTLEETGQEYFLDLANLGVFEEVERDRASDNRRSPVMCAVMHDFARIISRTECESLDGTGCNEMETLPTIRHLSILTDSAYCKKDKHGSLPRNLQFEKKLRAVFTSTRKLRTLTLIGKYDSFFFKSFQDVLKKAPYLRMLQISVTYAESSANLCNLEKSTHLCYLKLKNNGSGEALPIHLNKYYHLEVLDAGCPTLFHSMNDLVSMRYLFVKKGAHSSITSVFQNSSCFQTTQLQSMMNLVQLGVFQLENVSRAEAHGAKLRDKKNMEMLHLSWKDTLSQNESDSDTCSEPEDSSDTSSNTSSGSDNNSISESISDKESQDERPVVNDDSDPFLEPPSIHMETVAGSPVNDSNCNQVSEHFTDTARDVLEGFEPHPNLKHLRISEYSGATFPDWLSSKFSITCMQTLHLDNCGECQVIPSLEMLPFLTKLKLKKMWKVTQVSIPSLEELVLIQMRNLEKCSCSSVRNLNSSLRVLVIKGCHKLKTFPLFGSCEKFRIEQKSWLSGLDKLVIHYCRQLVVSNPLPPSSRSCKLSISRVSTLPTMKGSSDGELIIGAYTDEESFHDQDSDGLKELDHKILAFHNLRNLTSLKIRGCSNLVSISLEGLRELISLETLIIDTCENLFPSTALPEDGYESMAPANFCALPSLKRLNFFNSGIAGMWLSLMLRHAPALEELSLRFCGQITGLLVEEGESNLSNLSSAPEASSSGNPQPQEASSSRDGLLCVPPNLISSLRNMCFEYCHELTFQGNKKGFSEFTLLEKLTIICCLEMISSCVHNDKNDDHATNRKLLLPKSLVQLDISHSLETLQLCFPWNLTCLKKIHLRWNPRLESLQLRHCTALEELLISHCESLTEVEGLPSLGGIRSLRVRYWPGLIPWFERLLSEGYDMRPPRLVELAVDDVSILTTSSCMRLTFLERLEFMFGEKVTSLTDEQERALQLLTSLQELVFNNCDCLETLPLGLHSLRSLKRLKITACNSISRLPEKGLPPSLEELEIWYCKKELTKQCRELATSKLKVKIDGKYVN